MKKILLTLSFLSIFASFQVWAAEDGLPQQYTNIIKKCDTQDTAAGNKCLKDALLEVIGQSFSAEQKAYLGEQLDIIEKQVADAELNEENPEMKNIIGNPEKTKEYKAQTLNLILKKLLFDTLSMLDENKLES